MSVAAILPAYDEEATIGSIVAVLRKVAEIQEIVVVSDGSTDRTAQVAVAAGARVIELPENRGKAAAMKAGYLSTFADILLFLDADLIGLTADHVRALIGPVLRGEADMTIGLFDSGRITTDLAQAVAPYLSGQRCLRRTIMDEIFNGAVDSDVSGFGIEVVLTKHARRAEYTLLEIPLPEMTQVMKEEKRGLMKGLAARMKMYSEILKYVLRG